MSLHAERLARFEAADLYVVITEAFCGGRPSDWVLKEALDAGVRLIQFREKELDDRALYERAVAFREVTHDAGALLIIDDRLDVALAVDADGVHLGQSDLPISVPRRIAPDLVIGASTHSLEEALAAERSGAGYVNIGPIFATQTKQVATGALGPDAITYITPRLHIPWTVMGGINLDNIQQVLERGARRVAVVTAVTQADSPRAAAKALRQLIRQAAHAVA